MLQCWQVTCCGKTVDGSHKDGVYHRYIGFLYNNPRHSDVELEQMGGTIAKPTDDEFFLAFPICFVT